MIGQPAARIGVNRAEKSLQPVKQADDENGAAERLDVFGREAEPEFFAGAGEHERDEQQRCVAPQGEEFGDGTHTTHLTTESARSRAQRCSNSKRPGELGCRSAGQIAAPEDRRAPAWKQCNITKAARRASLRFLATR